VSSQTLSLIPTFILIGFLAYYAGLTPRPFRSGKALDRGGCQVGLPVSYVFATARLRPVSGASVATAAVFARIATRNAWRSAINKKIRRGAVVAEGPLASLIPPSANPSLSMRSCR